MGKNESKRSDCSNKNSFYYELGEKQMEILL